MPSPPCPVGTTAALYVNKTLKSTIWKWEVCITKLLNPCFRSPLALKYRNILIRLMQVLMEVILRLRVLSYLSSLSNMVMVVKVLECLLRLMREVLLHRRATTLLLLLLLGRVLRESLSVVRGGIFEFLHPCFVIAASCIAMVFCSFLSNRKSWICSSDLSRYPNLYDEGGTGCWFILSFLVSLPVSNYSYSASMPFFCQHVHFPNVAPCCLTHNTLP
jgi:hypothetical protein